MVDARADVPVENLVRKNEEREKRAEKTFSEKERTNVQGRGEDAEPRQKRQTKSAGRG